MKKKEMGQIIFYFLFVNYAHRYMYVCECVCVCDDMSAKIGH
jgi:hypothetical protein